MEGSAHGFHAVLEVPLVPSAFGPTHGVPTDISVELRPPTALAETVLVLSTGSVVPVQTTGGMLSLPVVSAWQGRLVATTVVSSC